MGGGRGDHSLTFFYRNLLVRGQRADPIHGSGGPVNFNRINPSGFPQTEVEARITGGFKTGVGTHFGDLREPSRLHQNARAETVTIGTHADGLKSEPMMILSGIVAKKER